jgi:hypothetical protein
MGDDVTTFRAGLEHPLLGPLSLSMYGTHLRAASDTGERLWGVGADLALFRDVARGPYVVGGIGGGFATQASKNLWGSWSAGAGYQVRALSVLSFAAEARWRELTPGARHGVELSLRLGTVLGGRGGGAPVGGATLPAGAAREPSPAAVPLATAGRFGEPSGRAAATVADSAVETAAARMGTA